MSVCVLFSLGRRNKTKLFTEHKKGTNKEEEEEQQQLEKWKHRDMDFIVALRFHFVLRTNLGIVVEAPVHVHLVARHPQ